MAKPSSNPPGRLPTGLTVLLFAVALALVIGGAFLIVSDDDPPASTTTVSPPPDVNITASSAATTSTSPGESRMLSEATCDALRPIGDTYAQRPATAARLNRRFAEARTDLFIIDDTLDDLYEVALATKPTRIAGALQRARAYNRASADLLARVTSAKQYRNGLLADPAAKNIDATLTLLDVATQEGCGFYFRPSATADDGDETTSDGIVVP